MLHWFIDRLKIDNTHRGITPDIIVPSSYGTLPDRLTEGTREALLIAIHYCATSPRSVLAFGDVVHCFPGSEAVENKLRLEIIRSSGVKNKVVDAGPISSTVTEAAAVKDALGFAPKSILVIAGEIHSRSVDFIWRKTFPGAVVSVSCIPYECEVQSDHPLALERRLGTYILVSALREALCRVFGLDFVAKLRQPQARHI